MRLEKLLADTGRPFLSGLILIDNSNKSLSVGIVGAVRAGPANASSKKYLMANLFRNSPV